MLLLSPIGTADTQTKHDIDLIGHLTEAAAEASTHPTIRGLKPWEQITVCCHPTVFIGQGARATCYQKDLSMQLLKEKVTNFWDMHVIRMLSEAAQAATQTSKGPFAPWEEIAVFCDPAVFQHIPDMGDPFRGISKLKSQAVNDAEETRYYITVSFDKKSGLANRLQTMGLCGDMCSIFRIGMYILWVPNETCDRQFYDTTCFDEGSEIFNQIPFIKVTRNHRCSVRESFQRFRYRACYQLVEIAVWEGHNLWDLQKGLSVQRHCSY